MRLKQIASNLWYKLINKQPIALTLTLEGTGSGTAYVRENKIFVTLAAAQVDKYVNLTTPFAFKVTDVLTRHDDSTACTVQVANTTDAITDAISLAASDTDLDRAAEVDNDYASFEADDDDLRLIIGTGAMTGIVEISIEPTVE